MMPARMSADCIELVALIAPSASLAGLHFAGVVAIFVATNCRGYAVPDDRTQELFKLLEAFRTPSAS
jgi:hypothetical protein